MGRESLQTCLREHKEGNYYGIWKHPNGKPGHYQMYCFACDAERAFICDVSSTGVSVGAVSLPSPSQQTPPPVPSSSPSTDPA